MKKIAIQGIKGSYHHAAANELLGTEIQLVECLSFPDLATQLTENQADYAVMAIENSIAGSILPNYNLLITHNLRILDELYLPINHAYLIHPEATIEEIQEIHSHPMAIMQCETYFDAYPNVKLIESADTALAAKKIKDHSLKQIGAIAPEKAAEVYGLKIVARNIQTVAHNYTRFFLLQHAIHYIEPLQHNKISIQFTVDHQLGSLAKVLNLIAHLNINLTKIQSVPIIEEPMTYSFFADLIQDNPKTWEKFWTAIQPVVKNIQLLGHYSHKNLIAK